MGEVQKFRKKPVAVEAIFYPPWLADDVLERLLDWSEGAIVAEVNPTRPMTLQIHTLEGTLFVAPGTWIIKGIQGEFCPCKQDIFEATYELAEPDVTTGTAATGGMMMKIEETPVDWGVNRLQKVVEDAVAQFLDELTAGTR
jgi:hypothetical protein